MDKRRNIKMKDVAAAVNDGLQLISFDKLSTALVAATDSALKDRVMEEYNVMSDTLEERRYIAALLDNNGNVNAASRQVWGPVRLKTAEAAFTRGMEIIRRPHVKKELEKIMNALSVTPRNIIARIQVEAETAPKASDRLRALELLSKVTNLFAEENKDKAKKVYNLNISEDAARRLLKRREKFAIGGEGEFTDGTGIQSDGLYGQEDAN